MKNLIQVFAFILFCSTQVLAQIDPATMKPEAPAEVMGTIVRSQIDPKDLRVDLPVERFVLDNGLTVLLLKDDSVPMISYHTWYKVGSRHESVGVTGAAHMLEHMMFKGAKKYSGKDFDRILAANGISNNAFTTYDYTGFYQNLPSDKLELMMDLEVDRMSSILIREEDLQSEKQVVAEERRWRTENQPMGIVREAMLGSLFKGSSYGWPVIGHMEDIQAYDSKKLRFFFENYYTPDNAILVLVGQFDLDKTKKLVNKYYGQLKKRSVPKDNFITKQTFTKARSEVIEYDVQSSNFVFAFPTVPVAHEDMYALDLAGTILGGGQNSRLYKKVVYEAQLATSAYSYHYSLGKDGMFALGANLIPGKSVEKLKPLFQAEIKKLRENVVSEKELQAAKVQVMKYFVDELTTIDGKARALATNEIQTGSYQNMYRDLERYQAVTALDIQRVTEKYLVPQGSVQVEMKPLRKNSSKKAL